MRPFLLQLGTVISLLAFAADATAMSALEFLRAEAENKEAPIMKDVVIKLVSKGYKRVPDWAPLSNMTKKKILERGYTNQDVEGVAEEAALGAGMTR
jgi:hypothetical protein